MLRNCKIVCKNRAYNFFIKVLEWKLKKPIFAVPKKRGLYVDKAKVLDR